MNPLFNSLQSAASLVVLDPDFRIEELNLEKWATTYRTSADDVRTAIQIAQNGKRKLPEEEAVSSPAITKAEEIEE